MYKAYTSFLTLVGLFLIVSGAFFEMETPQILNDCYNRTDSEVERCVTDASNAYRYSIFWKNIGIALALLGIWGSLPTSSKP